MPEPFIISGLIYEEDGTTLRENAVVWVYNKTKKEIHNGTEGSFTELTTNSQGEYQCNLANYSSGWSDGDEIQISSFYEDTAQSRRYIVSGSGGVIDKDLTLLNLEPAVAIQKLLRIYINEVNDNRNNTDQMIKIRYDREKLTKDDYPLIVITDVDEDTEMAGITNTNAAEERIYQVRATIYIWDKPNDSQILSISGLTGTYGGTKLRDYLARKVSEVFRTELTKRPSHDKNGVINKFYDYKKLRMESMEFEEEADAGILKKEIDIEIKTIAQTGG